MKKVMYSSRVVLKPFAALSLLLLLPSCEPLDWFKKQFGGECATCESHMSLAPVNKELAEEAVITFGDKVVLKGAEFEQNVELLMQSQAGIKDIIACMSPEQREQVFENILMGLVNERLISEWVGNQGLDKTAEYREQARRAHEAVDRDLAIRAFEREIVKNIKFSDDEAKSWYQKNKERLLSQPFLETVGGIKAEGVNVGSEKDAKDFAGKVKGSSLAKTAQDAKKSVVDFGLVTVQSTSLDPQIRTKIVALKQLPSTEIIKAGDNKYWVVHATSKVEPTFCDFAKVKDIVKDRMKEERAMEYLRKKVDEIASQAKVIVNKEYLKKRNQQAATQSQVQQVAAEQVALANMPVKSVSSPQAA
jgi:PPIC-type PPIASE domain